MRWTLLDGSPRGRRSNTGILLARLARGLEAAGHTTELLVLAHPRDAAAAPARFAAAERVVLGFPLYTDAMPGQVMAFIERLAPYAGRPGNPPIAFLVQSGFPEPGQSRAVERYLELLARRLGAPCLGTIVKGGVEGLQAMPRWMTRGLLTRVEALGRDLGRRGQLDPAALRALAGPDWLTGWRRLVLRVALALVSARYWDGMLRANGAWERRLERPHAESGAA
ncbi:MAG TPA: NAD(P)H-dependent oxidoreductase [Polyangia bacterium]|jgi:NAD(P)H-dependent FMN reductase